MVTTIVIADDHPIVLSGLENLIGSSKGFEVVAAAIDGLQAWDAISKFHPKLAVLDLSMPGMTGVQVLAAIKRESLSTRCVLLAASATDSEIYDVVAQGAAGVVLKEAAPQMLMDCLVAVADGNLWMPAEFIDAAMSRETDRRRKWNLLAPLLTARETEVVRLVMAGLSTKELAFRLGVSDGTAKVHLNNVFRKLDVSSRAELIRLGTSQPSL